MACCLRQTRFNKRAARLALICDSTPKTGGKERIQNLSEKEKAVSPYEANRLKLHGGSCGDRTCDSLLKRQILYLLS